MPSYLRELDHQCEEPGCDRRASVALYNAYNRHLADYCRPCGRKRLRSLLREERRKAQARRERPRMEQTHLDQFVQTPLGAGAGRK